MRDGAGRRIGIGMLAAGLGWLVGWLAMSGCYERVTRAEGFGSNEVQVQQGNLDEGPVNRALYGEPRSGRSERRPGVRDDKR